MQKQRKMEHSFDEESALEETPSDITGDGESASMNEDMGEEQQEEVCESTFEKYTLNGKALLPMFEDVDMMEAPPVAAVSNEPISNIAKHEENDKVSLH